MLSTCVRIFLYSNMSSFFPITVKKNYFNLIEGALPQLTKVYKLYIFSFLIIIQTIIYSIARAP